MKRFLLCIVYLCSFLQATQQVQIPLPDDVLQHKVLLILKPLTGKALNAEVERLSLINTQYNRVMHSPAVVQLIIKKRLEPIVTKQKFDEVIQQMSQNQAYAHEMQTSRDIKDLIDKKNKNFEIIAKQIQPMLDKYKVPIDVINGKEGVNSTKKGHAETSLFYVSKYELRDKNGVVFPANQEIDFAKLLLDVGANINVEDENRTTPLMWAAELGNYQLVALYLQYGANILVQKKYSGWSALHLAVFNAKNYIEDESYAQKLKVRIEIIALLASYKKGLNIQDVNGVTPLMLAATFSKDIVKILLDNGADKSIKNGEGRTALDIAQKYNKNDIAQLLE